MKLTSVKLKRISGVIVRVLTIFTLSCGLVYGQADKLLDSYTEVSNYYTSAYPSGSVTPTIDNTFSIEGASSLKIEYSLSAGIGDFVEAFRNYGTHTQDLSFMPDKLSIMVKGSSGNTELFRYWLYEDINSNGVQDAEDELWYFDAPNNFLDHTEFQLLEMPVTGFVKFTGSGNGSLDLHRIRGFRITIQNTSAGTKSNTVYVDELLLVTGYSLQTVGDEKLGSSFIQIWNGTGCDCGGWDQQRWEEEIDKMQDVCLNELIVQYSVYDDNAWYEPSALSYVNYTNATLNNLFLAAEAKGFDIKLGLYFDEDWNSADKSNQSTYDLLLQKHKDVIDELYSLFGSSTSFNGWYIPQEINDLEWQNAADRDKLANWLQDISVYAHSKNATKTVMIAPFFNLWQPADLVGLWYDDVLTIASDLDAVFPQDGVGITLKDVDTDMPLYFDAIKTVCDNHGVLFGATIETFLQTDGWPVNGNSFAAVPGSIDRINKQIWEASEYTDQLIQFSWSYMQPDIGASQLQLYNDYQSYSSCVPVAVQENESHNGIVVNSNDGDLEIESVGGEYSLLDLNGRVLQVGRLNNGRNVISIQSLKTGVYLIRIVNDRYIHSQRIIKL